MSRSTALAVVLLAVLGSAMAQTTKPGALALPSGARTFGAPVPGKTNVLVGCLAPFSTRPAAANSIMNGVRLAAQDMAKELGPSVNVIVTCLDSRGDPTAAGAAMQALAARGAVGVIGDYTSGTTQGAARVADRVRVPLIAPSASSPALTKANDYFFRVVPNDLVQATAASDMVRVKGAHAQADAHTHAGAEGGDAVAVITDGSLYGNSLAEAFSAALKKDGGKVVATVKLESAAGAKAAVAAVKAAKAESVFFAMNDVKAAAAFIREAAPLKLELFAGDSIMDPDLHQALGASAAQLLSGMRGTGFSLGTPAFRQRFTAFANTPNPSPTAALSYDAASLLLRAYKAATPPKGGVQVAAALPKTRFTGAVGTVALDAAGDMVPNSKTYTVFKFGPGGALVPAA